MRYLPHTSADLEEMLRAIGVNGLDALFESIPENLRLNRPLRLPNPLSELELKNHLRDLSRRNAHGEEWASFLGGGAYSHYIPSVVSQLLLRGEFLTAYTPYQPEVSQGTLQAMFEYQTMVAEILGLEVANASMYDGASATAEAVLMALRAVERKKILVARSVHPEYRQVLGTYLRNQDVTIEEIPWGPDGTLERGVCAAKIDRETACVVAASPNFFGIFEDLSDISQRIHEAGGMMITTTAEPLAYGLLRSPGEMGADIAVAEGQSFGVPMTFGGPSLGLFAAKRSYVRSLPGRLVGETVDEQGKRGFVLTLATREQHIRRERATSNICTNVSLCALAATITLALWGKGGFADLADLNFQKAAALKKELAGIPGIRVLFPATTFNEFVIETPVPSEKILRHFLKSQIFAGTPIARWYPEFPNALLVCVTEMNTPEQISRFVAEMEKGVQA